MWRNTPYLGVLPVPALDATAAKLLAAAAALLPPEELSEFQQLLADFTASDNGKRAHQRLKALSLARGNWLESMWLREKYLKVRVALPVAVSPAVLFPPNLCQPLSASATARAHFLARLVHAASEFYDLVHDRQLPLDKAGKVQQEMTQYDWLFGTTRLPGPVEDSLLQHQGRTEHFILAHKGAFYRCPFHRKMGLPTLRKLFKVTLPTLALGRDSILPAISRQFCAMMSMSRKKQRSQWD